jgi:hypothetical protein
MGARVSTVVGKNGLRLKSQRIAFRRTCVMDNNDTREIKKTIEGHDIAQGGSDVTADIAQYDRSDC